MMSTLVTPLAIAAPMIITEQRHLREQAENSPVVLWTVIAVLVLGVIASAGIPRLRNLLAGYRRIVSDSREADRDQMQQQINHLVSVMDDMRRRQIAHDNQLTIHRAWDIRAMDEPGYAQQHPAPSLYPINRPDGRSRMADIASGHTGETPAPNVNERES